MATDNTPGGEKRSGGNPGVGHETTVGGNPIDNAAVEDHTRQDGHIERRDEEGSRNPNRMDRDSDRRGAGDRSNGR